MNRLRCATLTVRDAEEAAARFARWFGYRTVERGRVPADLAAAWQTPASGQRRYTLCQPESGAEVFVRFIEGDPVPDYRPIRSYGWAAIELCVTDVEAVHARMRDSPFEVIGQPNRIPGLATIYPMQVRGPDQEIVYLTEILTDAPEAGLPKANSLIDKPFILVLACTDMRAQARWFADMLGLEIDPAVAIRYTMISKSFDLSIETRHEIITGRDQHDIFLEFDQYPVGAVARPCHDGALPPGVAICTLLHPRLDAVLAPWLLPPIVRGGPLYGGRRVGVLRSPEGALIEVVEARDA